MNKLAKWLTIPVAMLIAPMFLVAGFGVAANAAEQTSVTPVTPTMSSVDTCSKLSVPILPDVEGLTYSYETDYSTLPATFIITATPNPGIDAETTVWTFAQESSAPCAMVVTPLAPVVLSPATCGVQGSVSIRVMNPVEPSPGEYIGTTSEGVTYAQTRIGNAVIVTAKAQTGYVVKAGAPTAWVLNIPAAKPCPKPATVVKAAPKASGHAHR